MTHGIPNFLMYIIDCIDLSIESQLMNTHLSLRLFSNTLQVVDATCYCISIVTK